MAASSRSPGSTGLVKSLGTKDVFVAGVALVVASTTLVSDFVGYFTLGASFLMAIVLAFIINLLLGMSASELSVAYPRAGAIYEYGRDSLGGRLGSIVGLFLGLTFVGMFLLVGPGETAAGGFGLQALFNSGSNLNLYIIILSVLALIPNILGIRLTAWVSAVLLIGMLAIRWLFGIAGFLGIGDQTSWSSANLDTGGPGVFDWFGDNGLLAAGLVLAFWTFVGIEFVCSLTEEVGEPRRAMPRGIVIGLIVILGTSWLMGLGVAGTAPASGGTWADVALGAAGCDGNCPQLAVGQEFFGGFGRGLMSLASIFATLGSMTVAFAAIPRIIYGIARRGQFFGPQLSKVFAWTHPQWGTPVPAVILFGVAATALSLFSADVVNWIFSGAYVWILMYVAFHVIALANRILRPQGEQVFGSWFIALPIVGIVLTIVSLYYAFLGAHGEFGKRAIYVLVGAAVATAISYFLPGGQGVAEDVATDTTQARQAAGA